MTHKVNTRPKNTPTPIIIVLHSPYEKLSTYTEQILDLNVNPLPGRMLNTNKFKLNAE